MTEKIPSIEDFPLDGRTWRVDWFGAVERNYEVPSERRIQVIISPLATNYGDLASSRSVVDSHRRPINVGVGQLPLVRIGSLWKRGELLPDRAGKVEHFKGLKISPQTVRLIRSDHEVGGEPLIPPSYHAVGPDGLEARCLAVEYKGDPHGIIIPAAEVIRFYYSHSTDLAHAIFDGDFQYKPSSVVMLEDSYFDEVEKVCQLRLRSNFDDVDALTIGRIFHSQIAMNGARLVHNSLKRDAVNRVPALYPETAFPFNAKTSIRARVKPIKSCGAWRYLVFALEHCTGPFPFNHLIGDRENRNFSVEDGEGDRDKEEDGYNPGPPRKTTRHDDKGNIQNRQEPSSHSGIKRIVASNHQFGAVANIRYEKFIPTENKSKGKGRRLSDIVAAPIAQYGTGRGTYSKNETGGVRFVSDREEQDARPMPESLVRFVKVVEELNKVEGCSAIIRPPSNATQFVPLTRARGLRQWSYLSSSRYIRRQVLIADACVQGRSFSMVEFEWRKSEYFKLALLLGLGNSYLRNESIARVLMSMAKKHGRWEKISTLSDGIQMLTMMHTWLSKEHFGRLIKERITSNLPHSGI